MDAIINIFIGVVAGIVTYIVIELSIKISIDIIIPWYQTKIYRGHNINGEWYGYGAMVQPTGEYIQNTESDSSIVIKQQGNKISGELLLTMQSSGKRCRKVFDLSGSFVDTILVINTTAKDSNNMGTGSIIMKLQENGEKLKGKHTFISSYNWTTVASLDKVWTRKQ